MLLYLTVYYYMSLHRITKYMVICFLCYYTLSCILDIIIIVVFIITIIVIIMKKSIYILYHIIDCIYVMFENTMIQFIFYHICVGFDGKS